MNALFATVNQVFGRFPQLDYCRVHGNQIIEHSSENETAWNVVGSWSEQPNISLRLTAKNTFVCQGLNFSVHVTKRHSNI